MKRSVIRENGAANFPHSASLHAGYISSPRRDKGGYMDVIRRKVEGITHIGKIRPWFHLTALVVDIFNFRLSDILESDQLGLHETF